MLFRASALPRLVRCLGFESISNPYRGNTEVRKRGKTQPYSALPLLRASAIGSMPWVPVRSPILIAKTRKYENAERPCLIPRFRSFALPRSDRCLGFELDLQSLSRKRGSAKTRKDPA